MQEEKRARKVQRPGKQSRSARGSVSGARGARSSRSVGSKRKPEEGSLLEAQRTKQVQKVVTERYVGKPKGKIKFSGSVAFRKPV